MLASLLKKHLLLTLQIRLEISPCLPNKTLTFVCTKVARNIPRCPYKYALAAFSASNTQSPLYPDVDISLYAYNVKVVFHYNCKTQMHLWFAEMLTVNLISCHFAATIARFEIAMN